MEVTLTTRGQMFLGLSTVLIVASLSFPTIFFVLLPLVLLSYIVSYFVLRKQVKNPDLNIDISVRNSILYRGEVEVVHIVLKNNSPITTPFIRIEVVLPPSMYYVESQQNYFLALRPNTTKYFNVAFLPSARGSFTIGPVKVSLTDGLKIFSFPLHQTDEFGVKVFPSRLGSSVNHAQTLQTFSKLIGIFSTKSKGIGTDFHGLRDYIRGDPSKIVYWPATARAGKLISKEFEEEKRLETYVVVQGGSTMRGRKFDFILGASMDIYQGIIEQNQPCGYIFFDNDVRVHFNPALGSREKMKIWATIFPLLPRDKYGSYRALRSHVIKKRITNSLFIIVGDIEVSDQEILSCIRTMILNKNKVIFLDVMGYGFSYKSNIIDTGEDFEDSVYGIFLREIVDKSIEHGEYISAVNFKKNLNRLGGIYGYFSGPEENIVTVLNRSMFSHFGRIWRMRS